MATTLAKISIKDSSSWNTYLNLIYPVRSVYFSYTSTSPATRFGGTWSAISSRFIYTGGSGTGGAKDNRITLTVGNLPSHQHYPSRRTYVYSAEGVGAQGYAPDGGAFASWGWLRDNVYSTSLPTAFASTATGLSQAFSIAPQYQQLYCWRRTA